MKLSILICTLKSREEKLIRLCDILKPQVEKFKKQVEVIIANDTGENSIGYKRNYLVNMANIYIEPNEYLCFIDDDDTVSDNYIELLLEKIKLAPDVIVFDAFRFANGKPDRIVKYGIEYNKDYHDKNAYYRMPNHLMCVKKSLAVQIPFKEINFGEDSDYAKRLYPLLKTQERINETLYNYLYVDK